ncbi:MAG: hypothetical protein H0U45_14505 [Tatlockia sp.]|jgi:hypothetical protein|nr:hypothetical protein [Tatlockia sp.]
MFIKKKLVIFLLIAFSVYGCKNTLVTVDKFEEVESPPQNPIVEIWKEVEGSVGIEGNTLLFRLNDEGTVEFDEEIRIRREVVPPNVDFFIQRRGPAALSKEAFYEFKLLLKDLANSSIKKEYKPTGLLLDVRAKFTIIYKEDGISKKIIINENNITTIDISDQSRFPASLRKLIHEVYLIRESVKPRN